MYFQHDFNYYFVTGTKKDLRQIERRFSNAHTRDKCDVKFNRIETLPKNIPHQIPGINVQKSILDEPFSVTALLKRIIESPKAAQYTEQNVPGLFIRVYELGFDQFIGKRFPYQPLNCRVAQVVLKDLGFKEAVSSGNNSCVLSFSLHQTFSIPLNGVSTRQRIIKVWPRRNNVNHRAILFDRAFPHHIDIRPPWCKGKYNACFFPGCFSCTPQQQAGQPAPQVPAPAPYIGPQQQAGQPAPQVPAPAPYIGPQQQAGQPAPQVPAPAPYIGPQQQAGQPAPQVPAPAPYIGPQQQVAHPAPQPPAPAAQQHPQQPPPPGTE